jgi:hypothetical protein
MKIKNFFIKIFNINTFILILSLNILLFTFLNKNGILNKTLYYYKNKKIIKNHIKIKEKEIRNLKSKLKLLKNKEPEIIEIIDFNYKKKIPYKKYEIIKIK